MLDLQGFEVEIGSDAQGMLPNSTPVAAHEAFPVFDKSLSYDQLAEALTAFFVSRLSSKPISKNTLKNNWLNAEGRISRIYKTLQSPPLKTESGRITPFGIKTVFEFTLLVHTGSKPYDDYVLEVQSRYALKASQPVTEAGASVPSAAEPVAKAELVDECDSGKLANFNVQQSTKQIQPLFQVNIQSLQVTNLNSDTSQVETETAQLDSLSSQLAGLIGNQLRAEGKAGIQQVRAEIQHTVSAVKTQTLYGMLEEMQQGKPPAADDSGTAS